MTRICSLVMRHKEKLLLCRDVNEGIVHFPSAEFDEILDYSGLECAVRGFNENTLLVNFKYKCIENPVKIGDIEYYFVIVDDIPVEVVDKNFKDYKWKTRQEIFKLENMNIQDKKISYKSLKLSPHLFFLPRDYRKIESLASTFNKLFIATKFKVNYNLSNENELYLLPRYKFNCIICGRNHGYEAPINCEYAYMINDKSYKFKKRKDSYYLTCGFSHIEMIV